MSKTSIRHDPTNEKLDPRWVVVPLVVILGALAAALLWPLEGATPPAAGVAAATVSATPQPQQAAFEAKADDGSTVTQTPVDDNESQEDNHAPTF